ncbi:ABC transporter substrate-binding protein [Candidatus Solincola tengchongensis]|uniref:ABC transporter substrate-binding protein n=1 Tax=Candidatus Solincola tengchongensis TaxID=2900693 RepID=UPI002579BFAB|nr:ABC transporter substrate-binding protein [Candidatus Solincola tengchongensis]
MGMRWKAALGFVLAVLLALMGFAGCGGKAEGEKVVVKIGLTAPLSGIGAGYGQDIKSGLDMAIAEINSKGGIKIGDTTYVFELVAADDEMVPEKALSNAQRFVLEEDIKVVWDPTANTIQSLMGINETAGEEFLIMAYTSVPLYAQKPNKYMVTLPPPFSVYVKDWITRALTKGWKKLGMLQTTGAYGELWGKTFKDAWTKAGGTVVAEAPASYYTETDFTPYLTTVLAQNPDVIFCGGPSEPTALVIDQARSLGFKGGFIVIDQAKLDIIEETTGMEKLEGCIGVLPVDQSLWPATLQVMEKFEKEYNRRFTWEAAICYTGFHILAKAMQEAGSVDDVAAIRAAFAKGNVSVTSGEELPVEFSGINDQTGALFMPGTSVIVEKGAFQAGEPVEWWKQ